jgi:hypothetical protein
MFIDKKILAILALGFTAILMAVANFTTPANADQVIKDRDYQLITARGSAGGEGLYIMDERTGLMAVFFYDPNTHRLQPRAFISIADIFGG